MIKKYREINGITQEELAEKLDISTRQIQRLENYQNDPRISTLRELVEVLNVSNEDLAKYIKIGKEYFDKDRKK